MVCFQWTAGACGCEGIPSLLLMTFDTLSALLLYGALCGQLGVADTCPVGYGAFSEQLGAGG